MKRYYVSFLPFFRKTFTLEAVPKENRQWFSSWRSAYFYYMDRCYIVFMSLIRIQWPYNLYSTSWTNFRSRQSFLVYKTCIFWDNTVIVYRRILPTKVFIKQICFFSKSQRQVDYLLITEVSVESKCHLQIFLVFSNRFLGLF